MGARKGCFCVHRKASSGAVGGDVCYGVAAVLCRRPRDGVRTQGRSPRMRWSALAEYFRWICVRGDRRGSVQVSGVLEARSVGLVTLLPSMSPCSLCAAAGLER